MNWSLLSALLVVDLNKEKAGVGGMELRLA
jgi:hypothetical protein